MCLPMAPSGPDSVVMKPILSFCCCAIAGSENASDAAIAPAMTVLNVFCIISSSKEMILAQLRTQRHGFPQVPQRPVQLHVRVAQHRLDLRQVAALHRGGEQGARFFNLPDSLLHEILLIDPGRGGTPWGAGR